MRPCRQDAIRGGIPFTGVQTPPFLGIFFSNHDERKRFKTFFEKHGVDRIKRSKEYNGT